MAKPTPKKKEPRPVLAYEPKGYDIKRIVQRIQSEKMFEDLDLDPKYLPWLYLDNVIQRVFARVMGMGPYGPVTIKCNEEGSLYVAGLGGAYTRNETKQGNCPDAYGAPVEFSAPMGRVDITIFDNKAVLKRSRDGVTVDDEIELFKDCFYSIDCNTLQVWLKNYTALSVARYQLVGWY